MSEEAKPATCKGTRADGEPCGSSLNLSESGYCLFHDPERKDELREVRAAGGRAAAQAKTVAPEELPGPPKTLQDAIWWSAWATHAVATGKIDARTAHEIGYLCNVLKGAIEKRDLQAEIEKLRGELETAQARIRMKA